MLACEVETSAPHDDVQPVRRLVAALPERQRLALFLRYYADLDYASIAAVLDIEVGTVSATLSRAHATLRRSLLEEEAQSDRKRQPVRP
jgi:RNA polymerase sigma factor (sigma-70 family)